jgi:hypothetical protein
VTTPDASEAYVDEVFDAVVSHFQACGWFERINKHEPKASPGTGLTAAVWWQRTRPAPTQSGLDVTTAVIDFTGRIYTNMLQEPADMVDPNMAKASSNLIRRFTEDFTLDNLIKQIDVLGTAGVQLEAVAGYLELSGNLYRASTLTIPCIVNNVWNQIA